MEIFVKPERKKWAELCLRPSSDNTEVRQRVKAILERVKCHGDKALRELSMEIEHRELVDIALSENAIARAAESVSADVKAAIEKAAANIERFHRAQLPSVIDIETSDGVRCMQRPVPIEKVGLYIPGGTAPLFSTVLMLAIPARVAGCREISLCTPAGASSEVLYAASYCGIKIIYSLGGAQAIAAMAYGTETVAPVYKIFGPGNQYVTCAKQLLNGETVAIDMPAGPSEVMVIADAMSDPSFVAADLLSQAEHGSDSQVILVTDSLDFAEKVSVQITNQLELLPRRQLARIAIEHSRCLILDSRDDIVDFANMYGPEHLIVSVCDSWQIVDRINSAGSVFVGKYTPESAGDYASGTNHTLPTCGWAHSYAGVNVDSFMRKMTIQEITREGLAGLSSTIVTMAEAEGLDAHARAVKIRLE